MTDTTDWQLIRKYVQDDAQAAFAALVRRHLDLVYCICLRELREPSLAEDATQAVFLILARKARSFRPGTTLSSWLFQTALLTCKNVSRREQRRLAREETLVMELEHAAPPHSSPWSDLEPLLNEALRALPDKQRGLVLERFLEDRPLAEIGAARGISEDAARMRLNRALDRLRRFFAARNVLLSAALAALLPQAVRPAPAHCAEALLRLISVPAAGPASGTPAHVIAQGVIHTMNLHRLRLQLGAAALVALLSIGTTGAVQVRARIKARAVAVEKQEDQARALAVLDRMYATYAAMKSFKCDTLTQETDNGGQVASYEIEHINKTHLQRDKIRFERATLISSPELSGKALAVCDGNTFYVTCTENKGLADRYAKFPAYRASPSDFGGLSSWDLTGITGMPSIFFGDKLGGITTLSEPEYLLGQPTTIDFSGIAYPVALDVVIAKITYHAGTPGRDWPGAAMTVTYYVSQRDHLLYRVTVTDPSSPTSRMTDTETINGMEINRPRNPADFVFTPPPGSHEVQNTSDLFTGGRG